MESSENIQSNDDDHHYILSAVENGNCCVLENYLLLIESPTKFLNRVFEKQHNQKCSILMAACLKRHYNMVRMIVNRFQPDLELKNDILFDDGGDNQQMCFDVTVLWAAAAIDDFELVKLLVEHGANVNQTTKTRSTPLRSACFNGNIEMARYLIAHGADVHIAKENNDTNLAVSVHRKHLSMARYLVDELGCDVNMCDNDGRSSLYDAVNCGSLELVEFLLARGARNFPATIDRMTPLMWAAEKRRTHIFNAIAPHCSLVEQIEAEELLGSAFTSAFSEEHNLQQALTHYTHALALRSRHNLPKTRSTTTVDAFDNRQECQTIDQLIQLKSNSDHMYIEALLVRERLLGPMNSEYRQSIRYHGARLADNNQHCRAMALWIYELELREKHSIAMNSENLRHFASLFSDMLHNSLPIPIRNILKVMRITVEELKSCSKEYDFDLHTLLFLITITSQLCLKIDVAINDFQDVSKFIYSLNKHQFVTREGGSSLLHLALNRNTKSKDFFIEQTCKYPCSITARLLLQGGADVNAYDTMKNTPLHTLVSTMSEYDEHIFKILSEAGAHQDYINLSNKTVIDMTSSSVIRRFLESNMKLSLKCLCARVIRRNNLSFDGKIANSLAQFVDRH